MEGSGHLMSMSMWLVGPHSRSEQFWSGEQPCTFLIQTPDRPAHRQSLYRLHYPDSFYIL